MSYDKQVRRVATTTRNNRRSLYAPSPPPGGHSRHHSILGYWVPLITIGTIALGGLAAWIWSERSELDDDDDDYGEYPNDKPQAPPTGTGASYPTYGASPYPGPPQQGPHLESAGPFPGTGPPPPMGADVTGTTYGGSASVYYDGSSTASRTTEQRDDQGFLGRVLRRTPSPQQFFGNASRQVVGGMAAASKALGSIMESNTRVESEERRTRREDKDGFSDHERWSEEAEERQRINTVEREVQHDMSRSTADVKGKSKAKKTVAIVVNAGFYQCEVDGEFRAEYGSILSHLPTSHNPDTTNLFVLIYAPSLKSLPDTSNRTTSALGSSYSTISTPAHTPGSELQSMSPRIDSSNPTFDALLQQAESLVDHPTKIMPFSTPAGYVSILRHLAPQVVYITDTLSGVDGETVAQLRGWVGHTILVVGDEGHGGLADTETETEDERHEKRRDIKWWERSSIVGLGKEIDVVDATRICDDWAKRINGRE